MSAIYPELIQAILQQYRSSWKGLHGARHWARVWENGLKLANYTGAKTGVVELFAVFHDACWVDDEWDDSHGRRGADLAALLRGKYFELNDHDLGFLKYACCFHTSGLTEGDITVQTCWDADRLDLGRVGIHPDKSKLCTDAAKMPEMIAWANERAGNEDIPNNSGAIWQNFINRHLKSHEDNYRHS